MNAFSGRGGHPNDHSHDPPPMPLSSPHQRRPVSQLLPAHLGTYELETETSRDATREFDAVRCGVAHRKTGRGAPAGAAPATSWRSSRDHPEATAGSPTRPPPTDPSASADGAARRARPGGSVGLRRHATARGAWRETPPDSPVPDHDPARPSPAQPAPPGAPPGRWLRPRDEPGDVPKGSRAGDPAS